MTAHLQDTETTCHCGADYQDSDHCPECGCEQYESLACTQERTMKPSFLTKGVKLDRHEAGALFCTLSDVQALIEIGHYDAASNMLNKIKRIIDGSARIEFIDKGFSWTIKQEKEE